MSNREDIALMAHLMRRAGFGATRAELEERVVKGYEATVEELLNPQGQEPVDDDLLFRYFPDSEQGFHTGRPDLRHRVIRSVGCQRRLAYTSILLLVFGRLPL